MDNNSRWMVIANPMAGSGKVMDDWPKISEQLSLQGIEFDVSFTEHRYHSIELTIKAIRNGYRNFISVGGDGTTHEIVNGIFFQNEIPQSEITLAAIPAGSGNDWPKMHGITKDYSQAVNIIAQGHTIMQDIVKVEVYESKVHQVRYMANIGGMGYDALVCYICDRYKEEGKNGSIVYLRSALKALFSHSSKYYKVIVDGKLFFEGKVFSTSFGNGKYSGGGMVQTPYSIINDGLLELTIISKMPKLKVALNFPKLFSGNILKVPGVYHTKARSIEIESSPIDRVEVDGEAVGDTPSKFLVLPKALRIVCAEL